MTVKVVTIASKSLTQSMRVIQHRSYTIKTETVELKLLKPVLTVREQEMENIVLAIVEAE
jgi:hypothetical protein